MLIMIHIYSQSIAHDEKKKIKRRDYRIVTSMLEKIHDTKYKDVSLFERRKKTVDCMFYWIRRIEHKRAIIHFSSWKFPTIYDDSYEYFDFSC